MRGNKNGFSHGFILIDTVLGFFLLSLILASASSLFFSLTGSVNRQTDILIKYLNEREELVSGWDYEFR